MKGARASSLHVPHSARDKVLFNFVYYKFNMMEKNFLVRLPCMFVLYREIILQIQETIDSYISVYWPKTKHLFVMWATGYSQKAEIVYCLKNGQ